MQTPKANVLSGWWQKKIHLGNLFEGAETRGEIENFKRPHILKKLNILHHTGVPQHMHLFKDVLICSHACISSRTDLTSNDFVVHYNIQPPERSNQQKKTYCRSDRYARVILSQRCCDTTEAEDKCPVSMATRGSLCVSFTPVEVHVLFTLSQIYPHCSKGGEICQSKS